MATVDKLPMLAEGYEKLQNDVRYLKTVERPSIIEAIEVARGHGDLSENAEYHAAKERQGQIEAMIADIEDRLSRAMVIDPATLSGDKVIFGATVHLLDDGLKDERQAEVSRVALVRGDGLLERAPPRFTIARHGEEQAAVTGQHLDAHGLGAVIVERRARNGGEPAAQRGEIGRRIARDAHHDQARDRQIAERKNVGKVVLTV